MTIKEQIKARAEKAYPPYVEYAVTGEQSFGRKSRVDYNESDRAAYTKGAEDMLPVMEALEQDNARMREALGMKTPFSITETLQRLIKATKILLNKRDYDGSDYEEMEHSIKSAEKIIEALNQK